MGNFLKDFRDFAMRGNVVDLAVGVIIGGAFGKIVTSLVNDIIMPVISLCIPGDGYANWKHVITPGSPATETAAEVQEVAINYGLFIQSIIDFLIIAFCIFVALRVIQKFRRKQEEAPAAPAGPTQEELLTEIRDILAKQSQEKK